VEHHGGCDRHAEQQRCRNRLFEPRVALIKNDRFTKTGSGQTRGKVLRKEAFSAGVTKGNYFVNNFVATDGDSPHVAGGARLAAADYPHWTVAANVWAVEGNATLGMDCSTSGPDLSTTTAAAAAAETGVETGGKGPGCEAALAEVCSGLKGKGPTCHQCAFAHKTQLTKDGCSFAGQPPKDIMEYCKPSDPGPPHPPGPPPPPGPPSPPARGLCVGSLPDTDPEAVAKSKGFASTDAALFFNQAPDSYAAADPERFTPLSPGPLAPGNGGAFVNVSSALVATDFFGKPRVPSKPVIGFAV
jgi:hypothetical protein